MVNVGKNWEIERVFNKKVSICHIRCSISFEREF